MEKISSILPANARIKSVDLKDGQAARPGMPSFGRKQGTSALGGTDSAMTTAQKAKLVSEQALRPRLTNEDKAKIVQDMADGFFMKRLDRQQSPVDISEYHLDPVPAEVLTSGPTMDSSLMAGFQPEVVGQSSEPEIEVDVVDAKWAPQGSEVELDREDDPEAPEVGRYIDVAV